MGFIFIIFGTLMWSIDTLIRYPLLASISASMMVLLEHLFLVLLLVGFMIWQKIEVKKLFAKNLISFFVIGVLGSALSTLAFTKAFSLINPSLVILLQKFQPLVVISLSSFILKEKIKAQFFYYVAIALIGGILISYPDLSPLLQGLSFELNSNAVLGYTLTLLAVLGWGTSTVYGKKLSLKGLSESQIMFGRFSFGAVTLLIYCSLTASLPNSQLDLSIYIKVFAMVLISGLLGMYLYYHGLKKVSAHAGAIAELFFPLSAVLINWIFLQKSLQPLQIIGAVILCASSILVQRQKL